MESNQTINGYNDITRLAFSDASPSMISQILILIERPAKSGRLSWHIDVFEKIFISCCFEKLLSPDAAKTDRVRNIVKAIDRFRNKVCSFFFVIKAKQVYIKIK